MRRWATPFLGAMVLLMVGCGGGRQPGGWGGLVHPDVLAKADLQYYWRADMHLQAGETLKGLQLLDENVYGLTSQNRLIAVHAQTGVLRWMRQVAPPEATVFRPVHANKVQLPEKPIGARDITHPGGVQYPKPYDIIALNTETHVVVLNRADGTLIRDIELPFPANAGGDTDGHSYIVASTRGWVYMVNLEAATVVPVFNPDSMSLVPIEVKRPNYYLATSDGKLYAREMRVTDDRESWARALSGAAGAAFEVTERTVVVPSIDNRVYAIDAATGGKAWDYPFITQGPCRTPVQVSEQTVFQYAEKDKFYAINLINGQQRWAKPEARLVAGLADGDVMLIDKDRRLMIVDELLGTVKHTVALTGFRFVAPNTRAPLVYAASSDGRVVAVSRVGMPRVRLEQLTGEK